MKKVVIYTDGACSGNPGPGGWGAVLMYGQFKKEISGGEKMPCEVDLFTDSAYLCRAFSENWVTNWQRNGWKTSGKKEVENRDLWELLIAHTHKHSISWHKVKGHSDNAYNNRCDELARGAIAGCKVKQNGVK